MKSHTLPAGAVAAAGVVALATLALLWWPFDFTPAALGTAAARTVGLGQPMFAHPRDLVANVLVTLPLGAALARAGLRPRGIATFAAAFSVAVELGQIFQPERIVSVEDVAANVGGALAGGAIARLVPVLARRSAAALPYTLAAALAWTAAAGLGTGWLQGRLFSLDTWSAAYPLVIGDEATGDRPWCGRVGFWVLTASSKFEFRISNFEVEEPTDSARNAPDPLRHSTFDIRPSDLPSLPQCGRTSTAPPPAALIREVRRAGTLVALVLAETGSPRQTGPARVLTISNGPDVRNFTIGQEDDDLVVRVRRRGGGPNGVRPYYRLPDVFATTEPVWIAVRLTDRSTEVWAAGRSVADRLEVSTHWWTLLTTRAWPGLPGALAGALVYWLVLLGPVGLVIGTATAIARRPPGLATGATTALAAGCWLGLNTLGPGGFGYASLAGAALAGAIGVAAGRRFGRRVEPDPGDPARAEPEK